MLNQLLHGFFAGRHERVIDAITLAEVLVAHQRQRPKQIGLVVIHTLKLQQQGRRRNRRGPDGTIPDKDPFAGKPHRH